MERNIDPRQTGALEASHRDDPDLLYESPTFQSVGLGDVVEDAGRLLRAATTVWGNEAKVSRRRESAIARGVASLPDEGVTPGDERFTLAMEEEINARQADAEAQYARARQARAERPAGERPSVRRDVDEGAKAAGREESPYRGAWLGEVEDAFGDEVPAEREHGRQRATVEVKDRERAARSDVASRETAYSRTTSAQAPEYEPLADPYSGLSSAEVSAVNKSAARLHDEFGFELALGRAGLARCLARHVASGASPNDAFWTVLETFRRLPTVRQPMKDVDPYGQYQTTVEGRIQTLWQPKGDGQRQVGLITDGTERYKVTVWHRAGRKPTLREGALVRLEKAKVNPYWRQGELQTTFAIDAKAEIHVIEQGEGPGTRSKRRSSDPTRGAWRREADAHAWLAAQRRRHELRAELGVRASPASVVGAASGAARAAGGAAGGSEDGDGEAGSGGGAEQGDDGTGQASLDAWTDGGTVAASDD